MSWEPVLAAAVVASSIFKTRRDPMAMGKAATVCCIASMAFALLAPSQRTAAADSVPPNYFDNSGRDDVLSGGARMIPIETSKGTFHVWTKRVGNNPRIKVLLLHGGPGFSHEYL